MSDRTFVARSRIGASAAETFRWHEREGALERLVPPWERVEIVRANDGLKDGARAELRVAAGPFRVAWIAEHSGYEEGRGFRDEQAAGPFARWVHDHRFEPVDDASCVLEDRVRYAFPLGALGAAAGGSTTRRKLRRMFAWRHEVTAADLARHASLPGPPLSVGITGSSGLVGSALRPFLTTGGHRVARLARPGAGLDPADLDGLDAVVHLAGENIGASRWTAARKAAILASRVDGTRALVRAIASAQSPPKVLVSASAVGYYGDRGEEEVDESSPPGRGFLADVTREWEAAALEAASSGTRVVLVRLGVVLAASGGALPRMLPAFRAGAGGPVGSGRQVLSWVALDDVLGAVLFALRSHALAGPVNLVAPAPATSASFATTLGRVLRRPAFAPLPAAVVRALFGEMGTALLLEGQRVRSRRLAETGFRFRHEDLEGALRFELGMRRTPPHGLEME